jgi:hypothetical protein
MLYPQGDTLKLRISKRTVLCAFILLSITPLTADTITFEGVPLYHQHVITTQGFVFTHSGGILYSYNTADTCQPACSYNGTQSLAVVSSGVMDVRTLDATPFHLQSFQVAPLYTGFEDGTLFVTLTTTTGKNTLNFHLHNPSNPNPFQTLTLNTNEVLSFDLTFIGSTGDNSVSVDNLVLDNTTPAPEPSSALLLCSGLLGVGLHRRRLG